MKTVSPPALLFTSAPDPLNWPEKVVHADAGFNVSVAPLPMATLPAPDKLDTVEEAFIANVAPDPTVSSPVPRDAPEAKVSVPDDTVVVPVYVLALVRVKLPAPDCVKLPLPDRTPEYVTLSERLKAKLPVDKLKA